MVNLGVLLAERLVPPDLDGARTWLEKATEDGDTSAAFSLGLLLAYRLDPPDLDGARSWLARAAGTGRADAMFWLGVVLARLGDREGATRAWSQTVDDEPDDSEIIAGAALALAALGAQDGKVEEASHWLQLASEHGSLSASACAESLDPDPTVRGQALAKLRKMPEDTDALNFLGIASIASGQPQQARSLLSHSAALGDAVAQLLLTAMEA
jgi:TPR repeat protein